MRIIESVKGFCAEEEGAVTVDWVALVAAMVLLGIAVATTVNTSTKGLADKVVKMTIAKALKDSVNG